MIQVSYNDDNSPINVTATFKHNDVSVSVTMEQFPNLAECKKFNLNIANNVYGMLGDGDEKILITYNNKKSIIMIQHIDDIEILRIELPFTNELRAQFLEFEKVAECLAAGICYEKQQ